MQKEKKNILKNLVQNLKDDKIHKKFEAKKMDPDQTFGAVELVVPKEAVKKDKDL